MKKSEKIKRNSKQFKPKSANQKSKISEGWMNLTKVST